MQHTVANKRHKASGVTEVEHARAARPSRAPHMRLEIAKGPRPPLPYLLTLSHPHTCRVSSSPSRANSSSSERTIGSPASMKARMPARTASARSASLCERIPTESGDI
eukprot:109683-Prymnesium_polylepis.1